ncbi:MAG: hypothetical protein LBD02_02825 [Christensenellaceae bacterium]|jgi:hypothetical protein|nr:hypothetical protein [Christensenellaceae bacterium]
MDELPAASMGDGSTLADFLTFCNENYPADNRAVVFWNHGGGSVASVFKRRFRRLISEGSTSFWASTPA